ncbi:hypothetical protein [Hymenobacter terricola]|uniref:hypothetical protein n=1 Tax=Hymenobacter terricola TaxID=2819236 RepID=UPI001B317ED3|nr:hypothetical protein [Hymenobacter terricola]
MNFLVNPFQPVAGAAGVAISRVQLPVAGRVGLSFPEFLRGGARPRPAAADPRSRPYADAATHRAQHRAQCRAACMSKANF